MGDSSNKQTIISVITGLFTVVTQAAIGFFLTPFIVKSLGEEANGFAQLANNFVMYASLLTIAFNSMGGRFLSISYHRGEFEKANKYYSSLVLSNIIITLLLLPAAAFIVLRLDSLLALETADITDVRILFACVFLNFFVSQFASLFSMSMFVRNKLYIQNILNFLRNVLNALLLLCAFSFLPARIYYVSAIVLILSLLLLPCYYILHRRLLHDISFRASDFSTSNIREMFRSGIWNTINQGGHMLMTGLDLLLADLFINPVSMGVLSVSKVIPTFITHLAASLNSNLSPSVTIAWAKNGNDQALKELRRGMKLSSILVATPIMVFCGFGVDFYQLWMPSLDAKELTFLSFLAIMSLIPMAGPQTLYNVFTATNKLSVNAISFLITGVINIILVYFILSSGYEHGIFAIAGISAVLSIVRNLTVTLPYTAKILHLKWYEFYKDVALSTLCCGMVLGFVLLVKEVMPTTNWLGLTAAAIISAVLALGAEVLLLCNKEERRRLYALAVSKITRK